MGNRHKSSLSLEITRKQLKDSFIHSKLQAPHDNALSAPRHPHISPATPSQPSSTSSKSAVIRVNLRENNLTKAIGRRSSVIVRDAVAKYNQKIAEKEKKQSVSTVKRLFSLVKRRESEGKTETFEDLALKSPILKVKTKDHVIKRSASVGKITALQTKTFKLIPPPTQAPPISLENHKIPGFLHQIVHKTAANYPKMGTISGDFTKPIRFNGSKSPFTTKSISQSYETFSDLAILRMKSNFSRIGVGNETNPAKRNSIYSENSEESPKKVKFMRSKTRF